MFRASSASSFMARRPKVLPLLRCPIIPPDGNTRCRRRMSPPCASAGATARSGAMRARRRRRRSTALAGCRRSAQHPGADAACRPLRGSGRRALGVRLLPDGDPLGAAVGRPEGDRGRTRAREAGLRPLCARVPGLPAAQPRRQGLRRSALEPALRAVGRPGPGPASASTCSSRSTTTFPGLPQVQFYDRARLPWFDDVEAATADIRAELEAVMQRARRLCTLRPGPCQPADEDADGDAEQPRVERLLPLEERRAGRGERGALPEDAARAAERPARARAEPLAVDPLLAAPSRRAHPAAQRPRQHASHLPPAA